MLRRIAACLAIVAATAAIADSPVSFVEHIAPVLRDKCLTCHGPEKAKGKYRLDTFELLRQPGSSEAAPITPGAPEKSHLFQLLTARDDDDRMPQKDDPLPAAQIALIERWIREGAKFDGPDIKATLASLAALRDHPSPPQTYHAPVPITALAFHPDGHKLAASGYHEVTFWSAETGTLLRRATNVAQRTFGLAYSAKGDLLAAASGTPGKSGEAKVLDPARVRMLATTPDVMLAVAFDAGSLRLACAGADNAIRIFDAASGELQLAIEQHADWITGVAFSADGAHVISASRDKTARVFDAATGDLEATYTGHTEPLFAIATDAKHAFTGGRDRKVHIWETKEAKKVGEIGGFDDEIQRVVVSRGVIFVASGNGLRQYATEGKREIMRNFDGHRDLIYSIALHEPSGVLATGSFDGEVRLWRVGDGSLIRSFKAMPFAANAENAALHSR